jgi:energy-coupling factor transporter ATP-binding protein EcfA2
VLLRRKQSKPAEKEPQRGPARLVLENVRCFVHAEVPLGERVTVIIGANGSGKTTIAEALASLAPGEGEGLDEIPLRRGETSGSMALLDGQGKALARWATGGARARLPRGQQVFVYGQYRALRPPPGKKRQPSLLGPDWKDAAERPVPQNLDDVDRRPAAGTLFGFDEYLFRDLGVYAALIADLGAKDRGAQRAWERFQELIRVKLDDRFGEVELREKEGRRLAYFQRAGLSLELGELSDGYRAVLAIVLDLVIRYVKLFAGHEDPLAGEALVVIDEIDLNLHPRWQRKVIDQLTWLFPGTRFVVTTHSPTVVQAAIDQKHQVIALDDRGGLTEVRAFTDADLRRLDGAEVDSVLVDRKAFWVSSRYSPKYEALEIEAKKLRERIEREEATAKDERRLLKVLDQLRRLVIKEEVRAGDGPLLSEVAKVHVAVMKAEMAKRNKGAKRGSGAAKRRQGAR